MCAPLLAHRLTAIVVQIKPDALDQITQVVDPANQATTHTVNALGDTLQTVSADTGTTERNKWGQTR